MGNYSFSSEISETNSGKRMQVQVLIAIKPTGTYSNTSLTLLEAYLLFIAIPTYIVLMVTFIYFSINLIL